MKSFGELARSVKFSQKGSKTFLKGMDPSLTLVGEGRSAFVFKIAAVPIVLKVFFPDKELIAAEEARIYMELKDIPFYPCMYGFGSNYIAIDYISGDTLFSCLVKGLPVKIEHIKDIDRAIMLAVQKGLNPSDVHLRNIFITLSGNIKVIDVARFGQTKNCRQWEDIKDAFYLLYIRRLFPKKLPASLLNFIGILYKKGFLPSLT